MNENMTIKRQCRYLLDDGTPCLNVAVGGSDFCEQHGNWFTSDIEVYKEIGEHFRQDIREFWTRSNFYLLVHAGLLSVFTAISNRSSEYNIAIGIALGVFGLSLAIVWFIVARGSIIWIRKWRANMIEIDEIIDRHHYYKVENFAAQSPLMSPSNVTQYLPLVFGISWLVMIVLLIFYP
ncbi:MAG: hypothetical protein LWX52_14080 [Deltaproteobacteria bacterium]|jgi:hypothetical protein|nr:hypothetical protein [Deltaproteobacteria bacterium]